MKKQHRELYEWERSGSKYHHIREEVMKTGSIQYQFLNQHVLGG